MSKRFIQLTAMLLVVLFLSFSSISCYGNFSLVKKLYKWNGTIENKFAKSAATWIMFIIPVYGVAGFIDFVILNLIEFWSGENPVTMSAGDKEVQYVEKDGKTYHITATKNRFDIREEGTDKTVSLVYLETDQSWYMESGQERIKVAEFSGENADQLSLFFPNDRSMTVDLNTHPDPMNFQN
jgi:hypothetical protein